MSFPESLIQNILYGTLGFIIIWGSGYIITNFFLRSKSFPIKEKFVISPAMFFAFMIPIYLINVTFKGKILSSTLNLRIIFLTTLSVALLLGRKRLTLDIKSIKTSFLQSEKKKKLKALGILLIVLITCYTAIYTYINQTIYNRGDLTSHILWANQLKRGFTNIHRPPYQGISSFYTFLIHVAISFISTLLNCNTLDSFLSLSILQSIAIPLSVFLLNYKILKKNMPSLLSTSLICLYGGFKYIPRISWLFNSAHLIAYPNFLPRQIALYMLVIFLINIYKITCNQVNKVITLITSLILGTIGLTHPSCFYFSIILLVLMILINRKKHRVIKSLLIILVSGLAISAIYYIPLLISILSGNSVEGKESTIDELYTSNVFYAIGIVSITPLFSYFLENIKKRYKFYTILIISSVLLLAITSTSTIVLKSFSVLFFYRYTYIYYFCLCLLFTFTLINLFKILKPLYKYIATFILVLFLIFGYQNIIESKNWKNVKIPLRSKLNSIASPFRDAKPEELVCAVNLSMKTNMRISFSTGLDTIYVEKHFAHSPCKTNTYNQEERLSDIQKIARKETNSQELLNIIKKYNIRYLVIHKSNKEEFTKKINNFSIIGDYPCSSKKCIILKI